MINLIDQIILKADINDKSICTKGQNAPQVSLFTIKKQRENQCALL
jgi:hypothetical protein